MNFLAWRKPYAVHVRNTWHYDTERDQADSDFVQVVLEVLVILPEPLDVFHWYLDCLLIGLANEVHVLLLVPQIGSLT